MSDLLTAFWQDRTFRALDGDVAQAELATLKAKGGWIADALDLEDPERPVAVRPCRVCGIELRFDLFTDDGRIMLSPWLLRMLGIVICHECAEAEDRARGEREAANVFVKRVSESGMSPALAAEVQARGWDGVVLDAPSADDRGRRERAVEAVRAWGSGEHEGKGVWLHGPAGSGKTTLLALGAIERMRREPVRWVSVAVLIARLQGAWNDAERVAALKVLTEPGVVVLDDLVQVVPTERVRAQLFAALDARDQARVSICVSSNEKPSEVEKLLSSPMLSRLVSLASPMPLPGPDLRVKMALDA
jgi:hypothetical protein